MKSTIFKLLMMCLSAANTGYSLDVLKPVKTDSPQDTLKTFMDAMNRYRGGLDDGDEIKLQAINRAIKTLDLEHISPLLRSDLGRKSAVYLKEVIDRVVVIDYSKVPSQQLGAELSGYWRLKDSEIVIREQLDGARKGEYLFSSETVDNAKNFYELVKDYPYVAEPGGAGYQDSLLESFIPKTFKDELWGFPKWQIIGIFFSILIGFIVKYLAELFISFGKTIAQRSRSKWDDHLILSVEGPLSFCAASGFWFLSLYFLRLEGLTLQILSIIVQLVFSFSVIWMFYRLADVWSQYISVIAKKTDFLVDDQLVPLITRALRTFILIFGILIAIQNLGVNVMSLIAGLGLGGLAFALAAKDTAANLFGSIMIFSDRPFKLGDWIQFDGVDGTVEDVGFRSTRVRTFYDSLITIPNAVIANANIDNMGRRKFRRVRTILGVTYSTTPEQMEIFLEGIKNIIRANEYTRKDYFHVVFNNYGPSSLDILVYFFLNVSDWSRELVEKQNIFIEIKRLARELGVEFAFPSQSLYVESLPDKDGIEKENVAVGELLSRAKDFGPDGKNGKPSGLGLFTAPYKETT